MSAVELPANAVTIKGKSGQFWRSVEEVLKLGIVETASALKNENLQITAAILGVIFLLGFGIKSCDRSNRCTATLMYGNTLPEATRIKMLEMTCR